MDVSYDVVTGAFLQKVTEYELLALTEQLRDSVVAGYLARAASELAPVCRTYFTIVNDPINEKIQINMLHGETDLTDVGEIVNILSEGMIVQWLKPFVNRQENLELVMNTRDFTTYSPAELLHRVCDRYKIAKSEYKQMIYEYTYTHGDLTRLHI